MKERYTLGEVAELFSKQLKTVERWIARAGLEVGKDEQDRRYRFLSKTQVEHLVHLHRLQLSGKEAVIHKKDSEQQVLVAQLEQKLRRHYDAKLEALESRLTDALARIEVLEARQAAPAPVARQDDRSVALPAQPVSPIVQSSPPTPAAIQRPLFAIPKARKFNTRLQASDFLLRHRADPDLVRAWVELPMTTEERTLKGALARHITLVRCGRDQCPCEALLEG